MRAAKGEPLQFLRAQPLSALFAESRFRLNAENFLRDAITGDRMIDHAEPLR